MAAAATRPPTSRPRSVATAAKALSQVVTTATEVLAATVATTTEVVAEVVAKVVASAAGVLTGVVTATAAVVRVAALLLPGSRCQVPGSHHSARLPSPGSWLLAPGA